MATRPPLNKLGSTHTTIVITGGVPSVTDEEEVFQRQLIASYRNINTRDKMQVLNALINCFEKIFKFMRDIQWDKETIKYKWIFRNPEQINVNLTYVNRLYDFSQDFFKQLHIDSNLIDKATIDKTIHDVIHNPRTESTLNTLTADTVYTIIDNLVHNGVQREGTYTWLLENTVGPAGQKYTRDTLETALIVSGFNALTASYVKLDVLATMHIIETAIATKKSPLPIRNAMSPLEMYKHNLGEFVVKFIRKFFIPVTPGLPIVDNSQTHVTTGTNVSSGSVTQKQLLGRLSDETIYALINNLMYNRDAAYDWLIANTHDRDDRPYTRDTIDAMLIQYRFNDLVAVQVPITEDLEKSIVASAIATSKMILTMSDVTPLKQVFTYEQALTYFTIMFSLNFLQAGPVTKIKVQVVRSIYAPGTSCTQSSGDFTCMIKHREYADALFVFNDNEEQFLSRSCIAGAENTAIRPYQCVTPPRATGIPTGSGGVGYASLTPHVKSIIDEAIARIYTICAENSYKYVYYSVTSTGELNTQLFKVGADVKTYIVQQLNAVFA
jgi:hypothetical protein